MMCTVLTKYNSSSNMATALPTLRPLKTKSKVNISFISVIKVIQVQDIKDYTLKLSDRKITNKLNASH